MPAFAQTTSKAPCAGPRVQGRRARPGATPARAQPCPPPVHPPAPPADPTAGCPMPSSAPSSSAPAPPTTRSRWTPSTTARVGRGAGRGKAAGRGEAGACPASGPCGARPPPAPTKPPEFLSQAPRAPLPPPCGCGRTRRTRGGTCTRTRFRTARAPPRPPRRPPTPSTPPGCTPCCPRLATPPTATCGPSSRHAHSGGGELAKGAGARRAPGSVRAAQSLCHHPQPIFSHVHPRTRRQPTARRSWTLTGGTTTTQRGCAPRGRPTRPTGTGTSWC